jgi:hypothetical protein
VTVLPNAFASSHQVQTSSAIPMMPNSISSAAVRSLAKVVSEPEDLRGRSATTGRSSSLRDAEIPSGRIAKMALQESQRLCSQIDSRLSAELKSGPVSGVMTNWPFGLGWLDASLARNLL